MSNQNAPSPPRIFQFGEDVVRAPKMGIFLCHVSLLWVPPREGHSHNANYVIPAWEEPSQACPVWDVSSKLSLFPRGSFSIAGAEDND